MRLFVAVNLPPGERQRLHHAAAPLREAGLPVRWVDADTIHLTLKFLGEVDDEKLAEVRAGVDRVGGRSRPFRLRIRGFGAFPNTSRPRVFWVGVEMPPQLRALQEEVEQAFEPLGFAREARAYHPHLTLGRAREGARAAEFRGLELVLARIEYHSEVEVRTVDLMRSHLSPHGARYERVLAATLAAT